MDNFVYCFELYDSGNVINAGHHYVLAQNIQKAEQMMKSTFPNLSVSSFYKMSEKPYTFNEFNALLREHKNKVEELRIL